MIEYNQLNEAQKKAVHILDKSHIGIVYGGPGKGKTTVLSHILKRLDDRCLSYILAAPTGKAAKKMMEATGKPAFTIHKVLEPWVNNGNFNFQRNEERHIESQVLIIDESSMVDNWLMSCVLKALTKDHYLLLLGDDGQLQSVGAGAVLRDLINSPNIPKVELTEIYRNSGDIALACHEIKNGNIYNPSPIIDLEKGQNLRHLECDNEHGILNFIDKCYEKFINMDFNPIWDIQLLSPVNDRGLLSCKGLNGYLQEKLNKQNLITGNVENEINFNINDKVINTKNKELSDISGKKCLLVNGDMGIIKDITDSNKLIVHFENPDRFVMVSKKNNDLILAYACTVHRYQGSECPICIIPVHSSIQFMIDRPWIYTAISRASVACITIGDFNIIKQAINKVSSLNRRTFLQERIVENG